jgi:hypothetical protein
MEWMRRLLAGMRATATGRFRRVVLVVLDGLEPGLVELYLEQGLLHNLALLSDVGTRAVWINSRPLTLDNYAATVAKSGIRTTTLFPLSCPTPPDVEALCAADRDQQERLLAALLRGRSGLVLSVFDLPARLVQLFSHGPDANPDAGQQQVLRDVYVRMDEVVGKAFSLVDDRTALVVGIPAQRFAEASADALAAGLVFASCRTDCIDPSGVTFPADLLRLMGVETGEP